MTTPPGSKLTALHEKVVPCSERNIPIQLDPPSVGIMGGRKKNHSIHFLQGMNHFINLYHVPLGCFFSKLKSLRPFFSWGRYSHPRIILTTPFLHFLQLHSVLFEMGQPAQYTGMLPYHIDIYKSTMTVAVLSPIPSLINPCHRIYLLLWPFASCHLINCSSTRGPVI